MLRTQNKTSTNLISYDLYTVNTLPYKISLLGLTACPQDICWYIIFLETLAKFSSFWNKTSCIIVLIFHEILFQELGLGPSIPIHTVLNDWIRHTDGKLSFHGFVKLLHGTSNRTIAKPQWRLVHVCVLLEVLIFLCFSGKQKCMGYSFWCASTID